MDEEPQSAEEPQSEEAARHATYVAKTYSELWVRVYAEGLVQGMTPQASLERVEVAIQEAKRLTFEKGKEKTRPKRADPKPKRRAANKAARKARKRARR